MRQVAESSWLVTFDDDDERVANRRARRAFAELTKRAPVGLLDAVPAARTLLVVGTPAFDARVLEGLDASDAAAGDEAPSLHEIPLALEGEDLPAVLESTGTASEAFEKTVFETRFTVGFLGFMPGFAYLYGLPKALHVPRRSSPRLAVPSGAFAVAGPYAAIYPSRSPGGWNLVGTARPPRPLFEAKRELPTLLSPGDEVRFVRA